MFAKLTAKNQLAHSAQKSDQTPVKIQRADAVRAKLAALDLSEQNVADAAAWARKP